MQHSKHGRNAGADEYFDRRAQHQQRQNSPTQLSRKHCEYSLIDSAIATLPLRHQVSLVSLLPATNGMGVESATACCESFTPPAERSIQYRYRQIATIDTSTFIEGNSSNWSGITSQAEKKTLQLRRINCIGRDKSRDEAAKQISTMKPQVQHHKCHQQLCAEINSTSDCNASLARNSKFRCYQYSSNDFRLQENAQVVSTRTKTLSTNIFCSRPPYAMDSKSTTTETPKQTSQLRHTGPAKMKKNIVATKMMKNLFKLIILQATFSHIQNYYLPNGNSNCEQHQLPTNLQQTFNTASSQIHPRPVCKDNDSTWHHHLNSCRTITAFYNKNQLSHPHLHLKPLSNYLHLENLHQANQYAALRNHPGPSLLQLISYAPRFVIAWPVPSVLYAGK